MIGQRGAAYPNITTVATTLRTARSASVNGWGAICYHEGQFYEVAQTDVEILDRVGGGDSFASGLIYGLLSGKDPQWALRVRRRARRLGDVDAGRHHDGLSFRSLASDEGAGRED